MLQCDETQSQATWSGCVKHSARRATPDVTDTSGAIATDLLSYATVMSWSRYTSCTAVRSSTPSFIGF